MMNGYTKYHSKYYANFLTLQNSSSSIERLSQSMFNAQIDLNPHQIEAALFAFQSPLSNGSIIADEVGLGKTIEAGLVLCQYWSELKRKIIIIAPASLRKQWSMELQEKFFIDSTILESKPFKEEIKAGNHNPFEQRNKVIITSYQFATKHEDKILLAGYDLAIIDEAHKLRNVYKKENKIGNSIKRSLFNIKKILLTATPLQNSLLELYGLTSIIDNQVFGDLNSFKQNYVSSNMNQSDFSNLKQRLKPICHRTLRRDVLEYIKYTKRHPIVQEFTPSIKEQEVYDFISDFLRRESLYSIPSTQRALITLVMRKLLASSSRAIVGTLTTMIDRLELALKEHQKINSLDLILDEDELLEDYLDENDINTELEFSLSQDEIVQITNELKELRAYKEIASSIDIDEKLKSLIMALQRGLETQRVLGSPQKVLIFTESRRTQDYLYEYLSNNGYKGKVVLFNGTNSDKTSKEVYSNWIKKNQGTNKITGSKTADTKQALVDCFKNEATIMIATEAGSEGINLQFCNLVVNYDLPWNPQRIEQRIGRCHRYGQKFDVVVVNFVNTKNKADQRVFELLSEKFELFDGVFGASDEVLGSIESGVDFEKRILEIYQTCRDSTEIDEAFDALQREMEEQIEEKMLQTREQLLNNFDEDVHTRLNIHLDESKKQLDKFEKAFWNLTQYELSSIAKFSDKKASFFLQKPPSVDIPMGNYELITAKDEESNAYTYRINSKLGEYTLNSAFRYELKSASIDFDLSNHPTKISMLAPYINNSGYLKVIKLSINSLEFEEYLVTISTLEDGTILHEEFGEKLLSLKSTNLIENIAINDQTIETINIQFETIKDDVFSNVEIKNNELFDKEMGKLDLWADDLKLSLEVELKALEKEIKTRKTEARKITILDEKVKFQRETANLEKKRNKLRRELYDQQDEIEQQKEQLIDKVSAKLKQQIQIEELFTIKWSIK
jgi:ERCC4-related helicase